MCHNSSICYAADAQEPILEPNHSFENLTLDPPTTSIDDTSLDDFKTLLDFNLVSYFLVSKVQYYNVTTFSFTNYIAMGKISS